MLVICTLRGSLTFKLAVLVISIVIDCDRGHCYEYFKKKKSNSNENWARDIYLNFNEFWAGRRPKSEALDFSGPCFLCKSHFRVISMIKIVIWDQSKVISLIFEKIES